MTDNDTTTIQLTRDTKRRIDKRKFDGESYNAAVNRILDGSGVLFTEDEIKTIADRRIDRALSRYDSY